MPTRSSSTPAEGRLSRTLPVAAMIGDPGKTRDDAPGHGAPGVLQSHPCPPGSSHRGGAPRVVEQQTQCLDERALAIDNESGLARQDSLRSTSGISGDDRKGGGGGLEIHDAETFDLQSEPTRAARHGEHRHLAKHPGQRGERHRDLETGRHREAATARSTRRWPLRGTNRDTQPTTGFVGAPGPGVNAGSTPAPITTGGRLVRRRTRPAVYRDVANTTSARRSGYFTRLRISGMAAGRTISAPWHTTP